MVPDCTRGLRRLGAVRTARGMVGRMAGRSGKAQGEAPGSAAGLRARPVPQRPGLVTMAAFLGGGPCTTNKAALLR